MRFILSLCKSHIYELHAILAGTVTLLSMFIIKKPLKFDVPECTCTDPAEKARISRKLALNTKRKNTILVLETMMVGIVIYCIIDFFSPLVNFSVKTALLSGIVALTEYAVYEQIAPERKGLSK